MTNESTKPAISPILVARLGLALAIGFSLVCFLATTRHGMGLGNDSWAFTGPALAHLEGFEFVSLHHPPLFGWLIWQVAKFAHVDVVDAVRYLQLFALLGLLVGVWWQLRWSFPTNGAAPAAAVLLLATSFPIVEHAGNVGNDMLGAALVVWTLALFTRHLATEDDRKWLGLTLSVGALALLNRFAGFGVVLSVSTVLWLRRGRPVSRDFFTAFFAGGLMVLPVALVLLRNTLTQGRATSREVVWNGIPWDRIREALATLGLWYLPTPIATWSVGLALVLGLATWFWWACGWARASPRVLALLSSQGGFAAANFIFLIAAICFVEYGLALDSRTLLPYVPCSLIIGVTLASLLQPTGRAGRIALFAIFVLILSNNTRRCASLVASYSVMGKGHLGITYQQSTLPDFVRAHPEATFVVNNPPFFFNLTRRLPLEFPLAISILTNHRNASFDAETAALRARLRGPAPAYLVVFNILDQDGRAPAAQLMAGDRFERVMHDDFVSIYRFAPTPKPGAK